MDPIDLDMTFVGMSPSKSMSYLLQSGSPLTKLGNEFQIRKHLRKNSHKIKRLNGSFNKDSNIGSLKSIRGTHKGDLNKTLSLQNCKRNYSKPSHFMEFISKKSDNQNKEYQIRYLDEYISTLSHISDYGEYHAL